MHFVVIRKFKKILKWFGIWYDDVRLWFGVVFNGYWVVWFSGGSMDRYILVFSVNFDSTRLCWFDFNGEVSYCA